MVASNLQGYHDKIWLYRKARGENLRAYRYRNDSGGRTQHLKSA